MTEYVFLKQVILCLVFQYMKKTYLTFTSQKLKYTLLLNNNFKKTIANYIIVRTIYNIP